MLSDFGLLGMFIIVAVGFSFVILATPIILRFLGIANRNHPSKTKNSTYECGMAPAGKAWIQFNFRFYFFAILFVAFDVLTVFLYPWAANLVGLPSEGQALVAVAILIAMITVGYIYAWKKGALKWQ